MLQNVTFAMPNTFYHETHLWSLRNPKAQGAKKPLRNRKEPLGILRKTYLVCDSLISDDFCKTFRILSIGMRVDFFENFDIPFRLLAWKICRHIVVAKLHVATLFWANSCWNELLYNHILAFRPIYFQGCCERQLAKDTKIRVHSALKF